MAITSNPHPHVTREMKHLFITTIMIMVSSTLECLEQIAAHVDGAVEGAEHSAAGSLPKCAASLRVHAAVSPQDAEDHAVGTESFRVQNICVVDD